MKKAITILFSLFCTLQPALAVEHTVNVSSNAFTPANLTIAPGDVVKWVWVDGHHSVTSDTGAWPEAILDSSGDQFSRTFSSAGTFPYHCVFHGAPGSGMAGTVVVSGPNAAPADLAPLVLKTFPNPAHNQLFVSATLKSAGQLEVWNMLGQQVQAQTLYPATEETYVVDLKELPTGTYLIMLRQQDAIISKNTFLKAD